MKKPNTKKHLRLFCNSSESIRGKNIDSLSNDFKFLKDIFNKKPQENSIFKIKIKIIPNFYIYQFPIM